jgi:hypothetical protein
LARQQCQESEKNNLSEMIAKKIATLKHGSIKHFWGIPGSLAYTPEKILNILATV